LDGLAATAAKIGEPATAVALVDQAHQTVNRIDASEASNLAYHVRKVRVLGGLAVTAAKIGEPATAALVDQAHQLADGICQHVDRATASKTVHKLCDEQQGEALASLAEAIAEIAAVTQTPALLAQARQLAERIADPIAQVLALSNIVATAAAIGETTTAPTLLAQARQTAERIEEPAGQAIAFYAIARAYAKMGKWWQARTIATLNTTDNGRAKALAAILTVWAERQYPALAKESRPIYSTFR
jgi:hypothetical protein